MAFPALSANLSVGDVESEYRVLQVIDAANAKYVVEPVTVATSTAAVEELDVPATTAGGTAVISHSMDVVASVDLIDQSNGRRVLADWFQQGAVSSADVQIDFAAAVATGDYKVRIGGTTTGGSSGGGGSTVMLDHITNNATAWWAANDLAASQTWTDRIGSHVAQLGATTSAEADDPTFVAGSPSRLDFDGGDFLEMASYGAFAGLNTELDNDGGDFTIVIRGTYPGAGAQANLLTLWSSTDSSVVYEIYNRRTSFDFTLNTLTVGSSRDTARHPAGAWSAGDPFVVVCGSASGVLYVMTDQSTDSANTVYASTGAQANGTFGIDRMRAGESETGGNRYQGGLSDVILMHGVDPQTVDVAEMASFLNAASYT